MLPGCVLPVAVVTAVLSYAGWTAAARAEDFAGQGLVTLVAATLFWLAIMALAAYAVQRAVQRYRGDR